MLGMVVLCEVSVSRGLGSCRYKNVDGEALLYLSVPFYDMARAQ